MKYAVTSDTKTADARSGWRKRLSGSELWQHPDFLRLWAAHTVSVFGSQITVVALPLVAILTLDATAVEIGVLRAAQVIPALLLGLVAGALIDRVRRRPVMLWTDVGRGAALGVIPLAGAFGLLRMELLYVVGFLVGAMTVFFDIARFSFLPSLVDRRHLTDGNSKLEASWSSATIIGPSLGGVLVQLLTAPFAIALDALSFCASALFLSRIRAREPEPAPRQGGAGMVGEIREGLSFVLGNPLLHPIVMTTATFILGYGMFGTVYILFLSRELGLSPAVIGLIFAAAGPGFLIGALLARRTAERFGVGRALIGTQLVTGCLMLTVPLADGPWWVAVAWLAIVNLVSGVGGQISGINQISLRQHITPNHLLGRTNATMRFISWSGAPLAALAGGLVGQVVGLRPALFIGAALMLLAVAPLVFSAIRTLRFPPDGESSSSSPAA